MRSPAPPANPIGMAAISIERELIVDDAQRRIELHYLPLGVVGIITPWNAPINLAAGPLTMALYTGNTVVLKPSPYTPLCTLKLGELLRDCFPPAWSTCSPAAMNCGQWMSEHPGIDKISFTGSVASGKHVMASAAGTLKRVTLELGGNDAAIVLDDVDPQASRRNCSSPPSSTAARCAWRSSASMRMRASTRRCARRWRPKHARPRLETVCCRPANTAPSRTVCSTNGCWSCSRTVAGAAVRCSPAANRWPGDGYFLAPTIITQLPEDARLITEEQFGPLLPVQRFSDVEDAIRRANDTRYGLAASVWSCNLERAHAVAMRLEAGTVWINQHRATAANVPFGGVKESGVGRNYSEIGLKGNMEAKVISMLKT